MSQIHVVEDPVYKNAENTIAAGLAQYSVGMHGSTAEADQKKLDARVTIGGAPRSVSFSERVRDGATGDNRENFSLTLTTPLDLRAANDGDVVKAVTGTLKNLMGGDNFKLADGSTLADAYDWEKAGNGKLAVKLDISNGDHHGEPVSKVNLFLDLPKGVKHWDVVDALAGVKALPTPAAEAAQAPVAESPETKQWADDKVKQLTQMPADQAVATEKWADDKVKQATTPAQQPAASFTEAVDKSRNNVAVANASVQVG